jgi:hypothetical protein
MNKSDEGLWEVRRQDALLDVEVQAVMLELGISFPMGRATAHTRRGDKTTPWPDYSLEWLQTRVILGMNRIYQHGG